MTQTAGEAANGGAAGGAAAGGAAAGGAPQSWAETVIQDQGLREFAINKGYHKSKLEEAAPVMLQQYQNLEKLMGAEKAGNTVILPNWEATDADGIAAQNSYFERVGRPKEGKDYDLAVPQGQKMDEKLEKWSRENFHKLGLTSRQATSLSKAYQELETAEKTAKQQADQQRFATEDAGLKTEWGAAYADRIAKASAVAKKLGVKPETIDSLQSVSGYGEVMKMFASLADKVGEDVHINPEQNDSGAKMTPAEAKAELNRLSRDKDWMGAFLDKAHPNHKAALERKAFLTAMEVGITNA